ncbi:Abi-alpha family protein [Rhizobium rhizogenes]|uniref:DUF4393 domain-containing protein n=1 Tax=Rhizobium rhizogenes TaxID=359 RepID=A0AA92H781_RHIRH|nr:Abi-alpha family protein [Rhizobium rhizogenes]PVE50199.1 hypothetical protein DC430_22780 [Rhizobium rhizogenes]PVE62540.1 hypothetical protein DC415_21435 [Agrobacterium tumefaciens]PVE70678.1 hypothetical protein DCP16_21435 [Sphingomonas sp. TPD3009]
MSSEVEETAKAVREVAGTTGKLVDAARGAGGFLDRIFGNGLEDTVALHWSDRVKARRIEASIYDWERLVILAHKTNERLRARGITNTRVVPAKVALPLLEYATVEHDEDLQNLWANLLATGLDAGADEIHRKFVTTLGEMTGADASVFQTLLLESADPRMQRETPDGGKTWGPGTDGTYSHDAVPIISLNRLGLIAPAWVKIDLYKPGGHDDRCGDFGPTRDDVTLPGGLESVVITDFGKAFAIAVGLGANEPA